MFALAPMNAVAEPTTWRHVLGRRRVASSKKTLGTFGLLFRRNIRAGQSGVSEASFLTQTDAGSPASESLGYIASTGRNLRNSNRQTGRIHLAASGR
jgi:hypothetical protein